MVQLRWEVSSEPDHLRLRRAEGPIWMKLRHLPKGNVEALEKGFVEVGFVQPVSLSQKE